MNIENSLVISWTKANGLESLRTVGLLSKLNTPPCNLEVNVKLFIKPSFPGSVTLKFPTFWPFGQKILLSWRQEGGGNFKTILFRGGGKKGILLRVWRRVHKYTSPLVSLWPSLIADIPNQSYVPFPLAQDKSHLQTRA